MHLGWDPVGSLFQGPWFLFTSKYFVYADHGVASGRTIRDNSTFYHGTKQLCALREPQTLESAADCVDQAEPGRLESKLGVDSIVVDIVRNVREDLVRLRTKGGLSVVSRHFAREGRR